MGCCGSRPDQRTVNRKVTVKRSLAKKRTKVSQKSDLDKSSEISQRTLKRRVTPIPSRTCTLANTQGNIYEFYRKIKTIHKARSGHIWLALDKRTNFQRVVKEIKKSALVSQPQDSFLDEIEKMKELDHPNIVKLYELIISGENYYLVFELMGSENLFKRLKRKYINEKFASECIKNLLEGLAYCHNLGILHRNISLENILFDLNSENPSAKLNDFGFTWRKNVKSTQRDDLNKGETELKYLAPETFNNIYNDKSDIWSLGIVLYVILIGRFPFNSIEDVKIGIDWKNEMFLIYSAEMKDLLSKMLTTDYNQRISATDALNHPWFKTFSSSSSSPSSSQNLLNDQTIAIISKFLTKSKIEQYILAYIASSYIDFNEEKQKIELFKFLDKNHDGFVDKQELKEICKGKKFEDPEEMEEILLGIDIEENYSFSYTMFMAILTNWNSSACRNKLENALKQFSHNKASNIDMNIIKNKIPFIEEKEWVQFYKFFNSNEAGCVGIDQLTEVLLK